MINSVRFHESGDFVIAFKCNFYICVSEEVCDFPDLWGYIGERCGTDCRILGQLCHLPIRVALRSRTTDYTHSATPIHTVQRTSISIPLYFAGDKENI